MYNSSRPCGHINKTNGPIYILFRHTCKLTLGPTYKPYGHTCKPYGSICKTYGTTYRPYGHPHSNCNKLPHSSCNKLLNVQGLQASEGKLQYASKGKLLQASSFKLQQWKKLVCPTSKLNTTLHSVFFPQSFHVAPKVAISHNMI